MIACDLVDVFKRLIMGYPKKLNTTGLSNQVAVLKILQYIIIIYIIFFCTYIQNVKPQGLNDNVISPL